LNPAHKSGDAWVRIASSVQSRGGRPLILEYASCRDCTLEAMRTQGFANQCIDCTVVLFAHASIISIKNIGNGYGHPTWKGQQARKAFEKSANSPVLDTSYSEKGAVGMLDFLHNELKQRPESLRNRSVIFWASKSPVLPKGSVDVYESQLAEQPKFVKKWLAQKDDPVIPT
jgi:hypothetical protein